MTIEIRLETKKDIPAISELNKLVFESETEAQLVDNLREAKGLFLSYVAVDGETVVGHIAFSPMKILNKDHLSLIGLGPMAVSPQHQKHGIGSLLVEEGLRDVRAQGFDAVFVLGHPEYYARFGFKPSESTYGVSSTFAVPDEVFMCLELKEGCLDDICATARYVKEFDAIA